GAYSACSVRLAGGNSRFHDAATTEAADPASGAGNPRSGYVLLGCVVFAIGGRRDLLSCWPDLRDGAFWAAAGRKSGVAPLGRGAPWLCRGRSGASPIDGQLHPTGSDRTLRQRLLRFRHDHDAAAPRDIK